MLKRRRVLLIIGAIPLALLVLFFVTANYGVQAGEHYIRRPPIASISWGRPERYIVQQGVNVVWDDGTRMAGNFVEFPMFRGTRVSVRLFSLSMVPGSILRLGVRAPTDRATDSAMNV
jgi:hypothetical protein